MKFFKSKRQKDQELSDKGYSWAASELLRNQIKSRPTLRIQQAKDTRTYNAFDKGCEMALQDFSKLEKRLAVKMYKCAECGKWVEEDNSGICQVCEEAVCEDCQAPYTYLCPIDFPLHAMCQNN